jgi:hypothetical protein
MRGITKSYYDIDFADEEVPLYELFSWDLPGLLPIGSKPRRKRRITDAKQH